MIYGMFLYNLTFTRVDFKNFRSNSSKTLHQVLKIILAKVTVVIVCNLILTPAANVIAGYWTFETALVKFPARLVKNCIQCPVDCLLLIVVLFPVLLAYKTVFRIKPKDTDEALEMHTAQNENQGNDTTAKI